MKKLRTFLLAFAMLLVIPGCATEEAEQTDDSLAIGHDLVSMNGFVSGNELADMEEVIDAMITYMEESKRHVSYLVDEGVADNPLFVSFINNEISAYGGVNNVYLDEYPKDKTTAYELDDQEMYFGDYLDEYYDAIHFMTEDLDGDGEAELLINLGRKMGDGGDILVFHEKDGSLFEWEDLRYGGQSRYINLYENRTVEIVGVSGSLDFFCYRAAGRQERVFGRYSPRDTDTRESREWYLYEYKDGVKVNEVKITAQFSEDYEFIGVLEGEEKEKEYDRVYNDFINALGEEKDLISFTGMADWPVIVGQRTLNHYQFIEDRVVQIDPEIMPYIEEYVELAEDTKVTGYEWLQYGNERVLRIKIEYQEQPLDRHINKEDYFLFLKDDETVSQVLLVDYEGKELGWGGRLEAYFEDVTFDGKEDLIISLGNSKYASHYCAYVYENNEFRYERTFEKIPSYEIDMDKKVIYGLESNKWRQFYDTTYEYQNGRFVCTNLNICVIVDGEKITIPEEVIEEGVPSGAWYNWYDKVRRKEI